MKYTHAILFILLFLSCKQPEVTFDEPQPVDIKSLLKFGREVQGEYQGFKENSMLVITENSIIESYDIEDRMIVNELDSLSKLIGDTIINLKTKEKRVVQRIGDTLINRVHYVDTIFEISQNHILKKHKGYYFLNKKFSDLGWEVKKINLSKGLLTISEVSTELAKENLPLIKESPNDTLPPFKFKPSKKQFLEFIKKNGFDESETYIKL